MEVAGDTSVNTVSCKLPGCFSVVDAGAIVVEAVAGVELTGRILFIFSAARSGLEAADGATVALLGLGSRLMTGIVELDAVGRGAARRLLSVVVGGALEAAMFGVGAVFSDSGSGVSSIFCILLIAAFFSSS